jgi:hypothetical protein
MRLSVVIALNVRVDALLRWCDENERHEARQSMQTADSRQHAASIVAAGMNPPNARR